MNDKLKEILKRAEHWPEGVQDEAAASLQAIEEELVGLYELSSADRAALERSEEDVRHGRFASDDQVSEVLDNAERLRATLNKGIQSLNRGEGHEVKTHKVIKRARAQHGKN